MDPLPLSRRARLVSGLCLELARRKCDEYQRVNAGEHKNFDWRKETFTTSRSKFGSTGCLHSSGYASE